MAFSLLNAMVCRPCRLQVREICPDARYCLRSRVLRFMSPSLQILGIHSAGAYSNVPNLCRALPNSGNKFTIMLSKE